MKTWLLLFFIVVPTVLSAQNQDGSQLPASLPKLHYHAVTDFLKFPKHIYMSEGAGIEVDKAGNIYVFSRVGEGGHPLMVFDRDGNFLDTIGDGLYAFEFPHQLRFDRDGNLWAVDDGSNMAVKFVFNGIDWRPALTLGRRSEPFGDDGVVVNRAALPSFSNVMFNMPTDVAFGLNGEIYVADGYKNSRVQKFDKNGKFLKSWGRRGSGKGEFYLPHAIITDSKGLVYVGDRENSRIQIFDPDGNYLREWDNVGKPWALCLTNEPKQMMFVADGTVNRILKMDLDGHVLGWWGGPGKALGEFNNIHSIVCTPNGDLYITETQNYRIQKLVPDGDGR
ncbi:MAG TPA: peptidyl-alpha-hydroxyglycine alpha-amidating lyase family protein [Candidatus Acidoferrales bacterium]|jgi:DNA-binding beta-propeller fold protein YncE|nr:peptidyl-alpha-hydroxyglycine alpha-amidating lyase family protein [Candidatus Acidoferrales bacterium]